MIKIEMMEITVEFQKMKKKTTKKGSNKKKRCRIERGLKMGQCHNAVFVAQMTTCTVVRDDVHAASEVSNYLCKDM